MDRSFTRRQLGGFLLPGQLNVPPEQVDVISRQYNNVKESPFGAVGDGVADDTEAIAAAFADADTSGRAVFLPPGTYLTDTITYRLQSIIGTHQERCVLRGKPGKDILHVDATFGQFTRSRGVWRDFTLELDDTVDASASFPNRDGVGNACFATDFNDMAKPFPPRMTAWVFDHVGLIGLNRIVGGRNKSAGIYSQAATIIQSYIQEMEFGYLEYGWRDHWPSLNITANHLASDHINIDTIHFLRCKNNWRMVNWSFADIGNVMMHGGGQDVAWEMMGFVAESGGGCHTMNISCLELEDAATSGLTCDALGYNITMTAVSVSGTPPMTWEASDCDLRCFGVFPSGNPARMLTVTGHRNRIELFGSASTGTYSFDAISDLGVGNQIFINGHTGPLRAIPHRREAATPDCRPGHLRDSISGLLGHVGSLFVSGDDLLVNPRAILPLGMTEDKGFSWIPELSTEFRVVLRILGTGGNWSTQDGYFNGFSGFRVGAFLPAGKVRVYVKARLATAGTQDWIVHAPSGTERGHTTAEIGAGFTVFSFDLDLTGVRVNTELHLVAQQVANGGKGPLDIAWIMFRPWFNDLQVQGDAEIGGTLSHDGTRLGFFGADPVAQRRANANTSGATLAALEAEVNELKQLLRDYGLLAP